MTDTPTPIPSAAMSEADVAAIAEGLSEAVAVARGVRNAAYELAGISIAADQALPKRLADRIAKDAKRVAITASLVTAHIERTKP